MSLSRISAESSQIFCNAPNAPWRNKNNNNKREGYEKSNMEAGDTAALNEGVQRRNGFRFLFIITFLLLTISTKYSLSLSLYIYIYKLLD